MWLALHRCAVYHCPFLRDCNLGLPPSLFETLLLPEKLQMGRLIRVERYLMKKRAEALWECPQLFNLLKQRTTLPCTLGGRIPGTSRSARDDFITLLKPLYSCINAFALSLSLSSRIDSAVTTGRCAFGYLVETICYYHNRIRFEPCLLRPPCVYLRTVTSTWPRKRLILRRL